MKTLEFEAPLGTDHTLTVPPEIAAQVDRERPVRVILVQRDDEGPSWERLSAEQFLAGYDEADAIYDDPPSR